MEVVPASRNANRVWWAVLATACIVSFAVGSHFRATPSPGGTWKLRQLTADSGFSDNPAMSHDGKLVAYSSDHGPGAERDLYVKQVSGGQPIRLTFDGGGKRAPDFSPDGSKLVFQSDRDGGIYVISAFGGEPRLLAKEGLNPKFSPDGSQIAYWVGGVAVSSMVPGSGEVRVIPADGGEPRRVGSIFTNSRYPIWAPDGRHLLIDGYTGHRAADISALDWWLVATDGDLALRTGLRAALVRAELQFHVVGNPEMVPTPDCWIAGSNTVIFSTRVGDVSNLWETSISPQTGRVSGEFKRLTAGSADEDQASCATEDQLVFTSLNQNKDVWSIPFDLDRGTPLGTLQRMTEGHSSFLPYLSLNGRTMALSSAQGGAMNVWLRDLATGKESHMATSALGQRYPVLSVDGSRVAFIVFENDSRAIYVSSVGGALEKVCDGCLRATDWTRDDKAIVTFGESPYEIDSIDVASHQRTPLLKHATYNLLYGRLSPDNRWISFTARTEDNHAILLIAPMNGLRLIPQNSWIKIADEAGQDWSNWSPDGKTLYFTSARDGHTCLWAQRLDAISHRPVGDAFPAQHFHGHMTYQQGGWSAAAGRIAIALRDGTDNIWAMSRSGAH